VVPAAESGWLVPGDAKALVALDSDGDGWTDFLATRNRDTTLAFRDAGVIGRHAFRVSLRGPPGNPTAIGAQVVLELADGSKETAEVAAGSGWMSQSTAALSFGYTDENPPRRVRVRWPSGVATTHEIGRPGAVVVIAEP
jgi:hypothetical protein